MTILQDYGTQSLDHELALNELVHRMAWPKRGGGSATGYYKARYKNSGHVFECCRTLENQIRFMDNALYFLEEAVPDRGGMDDETVAHCGAVIHLAREMRDRLDLCYQG